MARGTVSITPDPSTPSGVVIRPSSFLEDVADWAAFKSACASGGAIYEADEVTNRTMQRAPVAAVPHLIEALQRAGFQVALHTDIRAELSERARQAEAAAAAADARIAAINSDLATRGEALWNYQPGGIVALAEHSPGGFLLADSPGLGKTVQALLAVRDRSPLIVITQASILGEWHRAIERWLPGRSVGYYDGRKSLNHWPAENEVVLGSYASVDTPRIPMPAGLTVVLDEAHNFSNSQAAQTKRWKKFAQKVLGSGGTVWLLTGTPLLNNLKEFWTVLQLAGLGEIAFLNYKRFVKLATEDPQAFAERLKSVMLRRLKREVLADLPPKVYQRVDAQISEEDRKELDRALQRMVECAVQFAEERAIQEAAKIAPGDVGVRLALVDQARHQARDNVQMAIDLAFDGRTQVPFELIARVKSILALAKSKRSMELLEEIEAREDSPILFFSAHLEPVRMASSRPHWEALTGEVSRADRAALVADFQAGKMRGLALTIRAGGAGLNLQRSHLVVRNDREWTPARNEQADDRAHRPGQTEPVMIFDVVADHVIDQRISDLLDEKQQLIDSTVEQAVTQLNERRRTLAESLNAQLAGTTVSAAEAPSRVWAPETDEEKALVAWAAKQQGEFLEGVTWLFNKTGKLPERSWNLLKKHATTMQRQQTERADRERMWVHRSLRLLAGIDPEPPGMRIDGPTLQDAGVVENLALKIGDAMPDDPVWKEAADILNKYRRQIGERP